jgi:hypothetical protein
MPLRRRKARVNSVTTIVLVIVTATFTALLATTARTATKVGDLHVLTYSDVWKWLVRLLWLFPLGVAIAVMISPPNPGEGWIAVALIGVFSAMNLVVTLEVFKRVIALGESGISQRSAWSTPVTIPWKDVKDVIWSVSNGVVVRSARGREVRVSIWMSGLETLAKTLETRLAHMSPVAGVVKKIRAHRV